MYAGQDSKRLRWKTARNYTAVRSESDVSAPNRERKTNVKIPIVSLDLRYKLQDTDVQCNAHPFLSRTFYRLLSVLSAKQCMR